MIVSAIILVVFCLAIAGAGVLIARALKRERDRTIEGLDTPPPADPSDSFSPSDGVLIGDAAAKGGPWAGTGDVDRTIL